MALDRLRFSNIERFGKLVKTWATGKNYLEDGKDYGIPADLDEFRRQNAEAQTGVHIPDWAKKVKFVACEPDTIVIRVPPKHAIEDSEQRLTAPGASYPLPDAYKQAFGGLDPVIAKEKMLDFHASRIGDYTSTFCL
jgi:hypothetical protein